MLYRKIDNWANPDEQKGLLYFAQRIEELTFQYSLDSFRAPTTNAPYLIVECISAIDLYTDTGFGESTVSHILEECKNKLRDNIVVKSLISMKLETYLSFDLTNLDEIRRKLRILRAELSPNAYVIRCFEMALIVCRANRKSEIDFLCREIVTTLTNLSVSSHHINVSSVEFFFGNRKIQSTDQLRDFFKIIFPHNHKFEVCLPIFSPITLLPIETIKIFKIFNIEILDIIPDSISNAKGGGALRKLRGTEKYLYASDIFAPDRFTAIDKAKTNIQSVHDLFGLFYHKENYHLGEDALVVQDCCNEEAWKVKVHVNKMQFISDNKPNEAAAKLRGMIEESILPRGKDRNKFLRAINFHGLSSQSNSVQNQILNIWTSLETMTPSKRSGSIVKNVVSGALPFLGLIYYRRVFKAVTFDIVRWNRHKLSDALKEASCPTDGDLVDKVFCLIALKENEKALEKFLIDAQYFELLKYRLYSLNKIFSSPHNALQRLEEHQKRVEWQLHRIYRTRNSIVHSGSTPAFSESLFLNAHDYFDQVFDLATKLGGSNGDFRDFTEIYDYTSLRYEQYISNFRQTTVFSVDSCSKILWKPDARPSKSIFFPKRPLTNEN